MNREKLIEKADEFRNNYDWQGTKSSDLVEMECEWAADFALSVNGWTAINSEDDLPKEYRTYVWTNRFTDDVAVFSYHPEANVPEAFVKSYAAWMPLPAPYEPQLTPTPEVLEGK